MQCMLRMRGWSHASIHFFKPWPDHYNFAVPKRVPICCKDLALRHESPHTLHWGKSVLSMSTHRCELTSGSTLSCARLAHGWCQSHISKIAHT
jgi:hypothetical protein